MNWRESKLQRTMSRPASIYPERKRSQQPDSCSRSANNYSMLERLEERGQGSTDKAESLLDTRNGWKSSRIFNNPCKLRHVVSSLLVRLCVQGSVWLTFRSTWLWKQAFYCPKCTYWENEEDTRGGRGAYKKHMVVKTKHLLTQNALIEKAKKIALRR